MIGGLCLLLVGGFYAVTIAAFFAEARENDARRAHELEKLRAQRSKDGGAR